MFRAVHIERKNHSRLRRSNQSINTKERRAVVTERGKMLAGDMVGFIFTPYWLRIWLEI